MAMEEYGPSDIKVPKYFGFRIHVLVQRRETGLPDIDYTHMVTTKSIPRVATIRVDLAVCFLICSAQC